MIESRAAKVRGAEPEGGGAATELRSSSAVIMMMTVTMRLVFATT
jgi:hypothetical protein